MAVPLPADGRSLGEGVPKQKCGSCHFFQEAGLAGSGWCHHPQRKTSTDVMIMVRRNELACRDEWSRNLWQAAATGEDDVAQPFERPAATRPQPPATTGHLRALIEAGERAVALAADGEDVLLSEARIVSDHAERWEPPTPSLSEPGFDPRTAIFRAREAYRDRVRARASAARLATAAEASVLGQELENEQSSAPEHLRAGFDVDAEWPVADEAGTGPLDEVRETGGQAIATAEISDSTEPSWGFAARDQAANVLPEPLRASAGGHTAGAGDLVAGTWESGGDSAYAGSEPPQASTHLEATTLVADATAAGDLPQWFRSDLPRICRACRDYRPSTDGQRGWCANQWAFTHRRLVQADETTPCHSAIGDWWVPVDDVWLVAADVSLHGRPTPLLDRLTGHPAKERRRS
jgi:hypothetical protein